MPRKKRTTADVLKMIEKEQGLADAKPNGVPLFDLDDDDISSYGAIYQHQENVSSSNALLDALIRYHADRLYKPNNE